MFSDSLRLELSTLEAWELVGHLAASGTPGFIEISERLENQLREIERIRAKIEELKPLVKNESRYVRKSRK